MNIALALAYRGNHTDGVTLRSQCTHYRSLDYTGSLNSKLEPHAQRLGTISFHFYCPHLMTNF